jgi:hypothetical protein
MSGWAAVILAMCVTLGCAEQAIVGDASNFDSEPENGCPSQKPSGQCSGDLICVYGHAPDCYPVDYGGETCRCRQGHWRCDPIQYDCAPEDVYDAE